MRHPVMLALLPHLLATARFAFRCPPQKAGTNQRTPVVLPMVLASRG
jgi:hypothetical protein